MAGMAKEAKTADPIEAAIPGLIIGSIQASPYSKRLC